MPRPKVTREATGTPGLRKVTRTYDDGRTSCKYEVRVKNGNALLNEGTFSSEAAARKALARAVVRIEDGTHVKKKAGAATFKTVADDWLAHGNWKPRTRETNKAIVINRLASLHALPIGKVTYEHVRNVMRALTDDGLAPATRRRVEAVLRAICAEAVKRDLIAVSPCAKVDRVKVGKPKIVIPTTAEVEQLVVVLAEQRRAEDAERASTSRAASDLPPWDLLVEFAAYTGLRAGEVAGLRVRNMDTEARAVHVEETVVDLHGHLEPGTPKSDEGNRTVTDLDPDLCRRLAAHVKGLRPGDYVFGSLDDEGKSRPYRHGNFVTRFFSPACVALGLGDVQFKSLRHYYASLLINEGVDVRQVAARLGHHDAAFTLRTYVHLFPKEDTGLGARIVARRAAARKPSGNVVPLRKASGS